MTNSLLQWKKDYAYNQMTKYAVGKVRYMLSIVLITTGTPVTIKPI